MRFNLIDGSRKTIDKRSFQTKIEFFYKKVGQILAYYPKWAYICICKVETTITNNQKQTS